MVDLFILVSVMAGGGAERIAAALQNELPPEISRQFVMLYKTASSYPLSGNCHTVMNYGESKSKFRKIILNAAGFFQYVKHLRKEKPGIVISIQVWENIWNLFSSLLSPHIPVVSIHGEPRFSYTAFNKYEKAFVGFLVRIIPKAKVIVVSNGVGKQYHELYKVPYHKIKVLYNPIDTEKIKGAVSTVNGDIQTLFSTDVPVIITAGRLNKVKGQHHLIRSFAALRRERPARLLICGVGDEEAYLKSLAKDLGVADDIIFLGWQENPYKYMARSTVFVLTSLSESFGNVLVEAMASCCPVISSNCSSGVREIIGEHNEYGLLAEPMTGIRHAADEPLDSGEESLLTLMRKVIDDKELREEYIRRGKERAEFFSVERRIKEYEEFIRGCVEEK